MNTPPPVSKKRRPRSPKPYRRRGPGWMVVLLLPLSAITGLCLYFVIVTWGEVHDPFSATVILWARLLVWFLVPIVISLALGYFRPERSRRSGSAVKRWGSD